MKAAVSKLGAVGALAKKKPEIEMEDRKDGYNQLIEEQVDSQPGDEENQLLKDTLEDDTLFAGLEENDPLKVERRALLKAKTALDNYTKEKSKKGAKTSAQEQAMKASLQKALLTQQIKFKEEAKRAQALKREMQKAQMKEAGGEDHKNIILPKY